MLQNDLLAIPVQIVPYCFSYALSVQELIYRYYYGTFSGELFSLVQTFKTFTSKTRSAKDNRLIFFSFPSYSAYKNEDQLEELLLKIRCLL